MYAPFNVAPAARETGQYIARAGMQSDSAERNLDILRATVTGAEAFTDAGAWMVGPRPQPQATMSASELAAARATYEAPLNRGAVLAGHGDYQIGSGMTVMPMGTSLTVYSKFGSTITEALGSKIEAGANLSNVYKRTYTEGERLPNYTLYPPSGTVVTQESSLTVTSPARLSDLLKSDMGACQWAACTYNSKSMNSDFNFGTIGIGSHTTNQWIMLY